MKKKILSGILVCLSCLVLAEIASAIDESTVEQLKIDTASATVKVNTNNNKISGLYDNVVNLQNQIDSLHSLCSCDITRSEFDSLEARVSALETGSACIPNPEVCDLIDNDCNGIIDDKDVDVDGYIDSECSQYSGELPVGDCGDLNNSVNPGSFEICFDGVDNDCDGTIDEGCSACFDVDGDGYSEQSCGGTDCNDNDAGIHPGIIGDNEFGALCGNGIDEDCDGSDSICFNP